MKKKTKKPIAFVNRSFPFLFVWSFKGEEHMSSVLPHPCPLCSAVAIVSLPEEVLAAQPDDTTHVCHPAAGGLQSLKW